ncbi:MAG TPA: FISUMP domain-containing protein [Fibrobacteraceae bacterium]|nr:FISUMP domain-containing protein [Fibrobacteraceae bacterium]
MSTTSSEARVKGRGKRVERASFCFHIGALLALALVSCSLLESDDAENTELIHYHLDMEEADLEDADSVTVDVWQDNNAEAEHQVFTDMDNVIPEINVPESSTVTLFARVYEAGGIVGGMVHSFVAGTRVNAKKITSMDFTTERYTGIYDTVAVLADFTPFGFSTASCSVEGATDVGDCALYFATADSRSYTVVFSDDLGHHFYQSMTVHVLQGAPTIDSCTDLEGYIATAVSFGVCGAEETYTNSIAGGIMMYKWDYNGDGTDDDSSSVDTTFSHSFASISADTTYTAKLTVRDNDGNVVTATRAVHVADRAPFLGNLVASDSSLLITEAITLTAPALSDSDGNQVDSLWWDLDGDGAFDDDSTLTGVTVRDSFPDTAGGTYVVSVRAKDVWGLYDTASVTITVSANRAPVLTITANDLVPVITETITLQASLTDADGNAIDSLWWDLDGDGNFDDAATSTDVTLRDSFPDTAGGTYVVSVRAKDVWGLYDTASVTITVSANRAPVLGSITVSDTAPVTTQTVTLNLSSLTDPEDNDVDSLWWDLDGDGVFETKALTGTAQTTSFGTQGTHTVSVYAWDVWGLMDTATLDIEVDTGFVDERDGQPYRLTIIGSQTWMAENLNYSGDDGSGNRTYTTGWCYGVGGTDTTDHSDSTSCDTYGRFYNWTDAMDIDESYLTTTWGSSDTVDHQGLCPSGWHVPTSTEWNTLATYLGGSDTAGYFLKSTSGWNDDGNGSDSYGFSALPAGLRDYGGVWGSQGYLAYFWSASEYSASDAWDRYLYYGSADLYAYDFNGENYGFSLRCTKD